MHVPVLADACIEWLRVQADGTYVDCTAGAGGHAARIAAALKEGRLIALDRDPAAVEIARQRLAPFHGAEVHHRNYGDLSDVLDELSIAGVDGILLDAGMSSMQLNNATRGFTFQEEGPLDMRMDSTQQQTAAAWLAQTSQRDLVQTLKHYGDVGPAKRVAQAIAEAGPIQTTQALRETIESVLGGAFDKTAVVRQVFQAIRIAVNSELDALKKALPAAIERLNPGGRLVVISFHSGEDRLVKQAFQTYGRKQRELNPDGTVAQIREPLITVLTKKPVRPSEAECRENPRAQSARLRAAERLGAAT